MLIELSCAIVWSAKDTGWYFGLAGEISYKATNIWGKFMSSPEISMIAIFENTQDCENVYKGFELASQNNLEEANKLLHGKLNDDLFTIDDQNEWKFNCSIEPEKNKLTVDTKDIDIFEIEDFFKAVSKLGAKKIVAEVYDGYEETKKYGFLDGKKKSAKSVLKSIADDDIDIALQIALEAGKQKAAIELLDQGANPDVLVHPHTHKSSFRWPALVHCIEFQYKKLVNKLIEVGANVNVSNPSYQEESVLHMVIREWEDRKLIDQLLEAGADVNYVNACGQTPLFDAWTVELLELLIANGANINASDNNGNTVLHSNSSMSVVRFLIDNEIDINKKNKDGKTALQLATGFKVLKLLLENGADIDELNDAGQVVKFLAKDKDSCEFLLNAGVNVNSTDHSGNTALHLTKKTEVSNFLLERGVAINQKNCNGQTALHIASSNNISKLLVEKRADVNAKDNKGCNAAFYLSGKSSISILQLMIEHGLDLSSCHNDGGNILWHLNNNDECAEYLKEIGVELIRPKGIYSETDEDKNQEKVIGVVYEPVSQKLLIKNNGAESLLLPTRLLNDDEIKLFNKIVHKIIFHNDLLAFIDLITNYGALCSVELIKDVVKQELALNRLIYVKELGDAELISLNSCGELIRNAPRQSRDVVQYLESLNSSQSEIDQDLLESFMNDYLKQLFDARSINDLDKYYSADAFEKVRRYQNESGNEKAYRKYYKRAHRHYDPIKCKVFINGAVVATVGCTYICLKLVEDQIKIISEVFPDGYDEPFSFMITPSPRFEVLPSSMPEFLDEIEGVSDINDFIKGITIKNHGKGYLPSQFE